jgi:hypothetical protein
MSDEPKKRSRASIGWFALLLLAYPLSMPPVISMAIDHNRFDSVADFYAPVFWVMGKSQVLRGAVDWYASFWGILVGPP